MTTAAAASRSATGRLSAADVARYRQAGYHYPVRVMSAAQAAGYMRKLEAHEAAHGPLQGIMRHKAHLYLTWLDELVRMPSILDAVGDILGPDLLVYSSSFFIKEPHDPAFVSWHQDAHYWGLDSGDVVTAWIAFVDSDTENGAMRVIPGTHLVDLPHVDTFAKNNMLSRGQEVSVDLGDRKFVELDLRAGDMSLHHVGIVHGSEPNNSDRRRVGFAVRYMSPNVKQTISITDGATMVRGVDRFNNFEHEPSPKLDMAPEALAFHRFAMNRLSNNVMKGTDVTMNDRR
jgi:hypothetical protein